VLLCFSAGAVLGLLPGGAKIATGNYARHSLNCNLTKSRRGLCTQKKGFFSENLWKPPRGGLQMKRGWLTKH
jgi:hypothetical protein